MSKLTSRFLDYVWDNYRVVALMALTVLATVAVIPYWQQFNKIEANTNRIDKLEKRVGGLERSMNDLSRNVRLSICVSSDDKLNDTAKAILECSEFD